VIAAKTPLTLWRQEMAPGFAPAPVLMSWQAATAVMLQERLGLEKYVTAQMYYSLVSWRGRYSGPSLLA
jgi:hypothetical protein